MLQRLRKVKFILPIILLGAGFLIYSGYQKNKGVVLVEKVDLEEVEIARTVSAGGVLKAEKMAKLSFPLVGRLTYLNAIEGTEATEGELLASVYGYTAYQNAQSAKDARDIALREKELFIEQNKDNKDAVGGEEAYKIKLRTLDEAISSAEAGYQASLGNLSGYHIRSPFTGTVNKVNYKLGETVSPGDPVIELIGYGQNESYFEMKVNQEDFGVLRTGMPVTMNFDMFPDREINGEIGLLPRSTESEISTDFLVPVRITEPFDIVYGLTGDATVVINKLPAHTKGILFDRIFEDDEGPFVWIIKNNLAEKRYVEIGLEGDLYTEIRTDLSGETVIIPVQDASLEVGKPVRLVS